MQSPTIVYVAAELLAEFEASPVELKGGDIVQLRPGAFALGIAHDWWFGDALEVGKQYMVSGVNFDQSGFIEFTDSAGSIYNCHYPSFIFEVVYRPQKGK